MSCVPSKPGPPCSSSLFPLISGDFAWYCFVSASSVFNFFFCQFSLSRGEYLRFAEALDGGAPYDDALHFYPKFSSTSTFKYFEPLLFFPLAYQIISRS